MRMRSVPPRVMRLPCAALLVAGAVAAAPLAALARGIAATTLSSIRVSGDARVSARPDRVQIDLGVQTQAPQSQDAAGANARLLGAVRSAVRKAAGPGAQIKTVSYSLSQNYQYHSGGGEPTITGYTAVNVVEVQ